MSTRDTFVRAYMAGAILALAAVFAITIAVQTGSPLIGAVLFPVGFCWKTVSFVLAATLAAVLTGPIRFSAGAGVSCGMAAQQ